jgi:serine/threonine-protein kinase
MSQLLDEVLPLDAAGREAWLNNLPAEHQDFETALRKALLTADGQVPELESLDQAPKVGPGIGAATCDEADELAAGSEIGPYRLIRVLGRGGMGSVWLAERIDGAIKRPVALKLPHSSLPQLQLAERFSRERNILAGLVHINIARLYDAGVTQDGQPWLALEYVEGEALTTWCDARKLDIKARTDLFRQVLAAVQYAHRQQVIHRDLKPSNILVNQDGEVRLLDFGIAKMMAEGEVHETALTRISGRALSIQYASPEQILGQPATATSDVYSLGVVLYELLTGSFPHFMHRDSRDAIEDSILSVVPNLASQTLANIELAANRGTLPTKLSNALKGDLDAILQKALKKAPAERYDSAKSLADDLDRYLKGEPVLARPASTWWQTISVVKKNGIASVAIFALVAITVVSPMFWPHTKPSNESAHARMLPPPEPVQTLATISDKSIAVLPFVDMSEKKDQEHFSDGLSEELIDLLARVPELHVPARTSSFYFKGKPDDIPSIAKKLLVAHVLEGSVRKSGNQLRITAQLIRADTGFLLWSQTYDRKLDDIFKVQDDIAAEVVKALKVTLLDEVSFREKGTKNGQAYELYLYSQSILRHQGGKEDYEKVVEILHRAIGLDPAFAPAYALLSSIVSSQAGFLFVPMESGFEDARRAAKQALSIDPKLSEAYFAMAKIQYLYDWDWAGAQSNLQQALRFDPHGGSALGMAGLLALITGRLDQAIELQQKVLDDDPLNADRHFGLGLVFYSAERYAEAQMEFLKALELNPKNPNSRTYLGHTLLAQGATAEALKEFDSESDEESHLIGRALVYYRLGRKADSDLVLAELEKKYAGVDAFGIAEIYAYRREFDQAFSWLDRAYRQHEVSCGFVKAEPMLKALRSDPRYKAFLRKMKLPE